jgi:hypothetical protein
LALVAAVLGLAFGGAQAAPPTRTPERTPPPGEGVVCAWAIYAVVAEIGARCFPGDAPEFQAELNRSVGRIDAYVLKNSKMTPEDVARFKRDQGHVGYPKELICQGDGLQLYQALKSGGAARLRSATDAAVARPGEPTWGTCL